MSYNVNQRMALPYMAPLVYLFICLNSITVYHVLWALAWNKVIIIIIYYINADIKQQ